MRFGHVAIRIKDVTRMLDFYCRGLGFTEAFRIFNDDGSLRIVYILISNGQFLELCLGGLSKIPFDDKTSIGVRHICLTVPDLSKTKSEMESRGVTFETSIIKMKDQNLAAYLFDPEGNKLELVEITADSPQSKYQPGY